jgi:hypothetical protein
VPATSPRGVYPTRRDIRLNTKDSSLNKRLLDCGEVIGRLLAYTTGVVYRLHRIGGRGVVLRYMIGYGHGKKTVTPFLYRNDLEH